MEESQLEQKDVLATLDWSILFLLLLIVGVLLSFAATVEQRNGLARLVCCGQEDTTDVFSTRWLVGILVVGATGFFAWAACSSIKNAAPGRLRRTAVRAGQPAGGGSGFCGGSDPAERPGTHWPRQAERGVGRDSGARIKNLHSQAEKPAQRRFTPVNAGLARGGIKFGIFRPGAPGAARPV